MSARRGDPYVRVHANDGVGTVHYGSTATTSCALNDASSTATPPPPYRGSSMWQALGVSACWSPARDLRSCWSSGVGWSLRCGRRCCRVSTGSRPSSSTLRGRDSSDPAGYRRGRLRTTAVRFLDGLLDGLGLDGASFIGHSMGGLWSTWLALDRPDRITAISCVGCPGSRSARPRRS